MPLALPDYPSSFIYWTILSSAYLVFAYTHSTHLFTVLSCFLIFMDIRSILSVIHLMATFIVNAFCALYLNKTKTCNTISPLYVSE